MANQHVSKRMVRKLIKGARRTKLARRDRMGKDGWRS